MPDAELVKAAGDLADVSTALLDYLETTYHFPSDQDQAKVAADVRVAIYRLSAAILVEMQARYTEVTQ